MFHEKFYTDHRTFLLSLTYNPLIRIVTQKIKPGFHIVFVGY